MKTIIFDFDGTIADTLDSFVEVYNSLAPKYKCKKVKYEDIESIRKKKPQELIKEYNIPITKLPIMALRVRSRLHKRIKDIKPQQNICVVLKKIKTKGYTLGILTNNSKKNVKSFLKKNDLKDIFDFIYTTKHLFGKQNSIRRLLKDKKIDKETAIYIGDETRDIEAVKKVGIPIIAVSWGYNKKETLKNEVPEYLIDKPDELLKVLKKKRYGSGI